MNRRNLVAGLAMLLAMVGGLWLAWPSPITAVDQEQPRLNVAAPVPGGGAVLTQTLVAGHDGFSAVDLTAVVYPNNPRTAALTIQVVDAQGRLLAQRNFTGLAHNAPLQITLPPQPHSAGQTYTIRLSASPDNRATVWAYSLDGYLPGTLLFNGASQPGDLRFSTTYTYLWTNVLSDAVAAVQRAIGFALPLVLVLWAPGVLLLEVLGAGRGWLRLAGARVAVALSLSLTLLALAWLWAGVAGWHWSPTSLALVYRVVGLLLVARALARWRASHWSWPRPPHPHTLALTTILLTSVVLRLLAARDLAFPAWVDSSHHVLVARVLEQSGNVPSGYQPALPVAVFYYHFALHVLVVSLHWLSGLSLVDTSLFIGQVLNGLLPLSAYGLAWGLTGRRRAALVAAFVVGLVSFFPGYFVTWGRYTQLTGLLVVGPAAAALWRATGVSARIAVTDRSWLRTNWRGILLSALLAVGVFLAHYRVLLFFVVFAVAALVARLRQRQAWLVLGASALSGMLLSLPWIIRLVSQALLPVLATPAGLSTAESYNAFPSDYFRGPLEQGWLGLALAAGLWGLWRRDRGLWTVLAWTAGVFAGLNAGPATWLVNNNSWAISLFLPGSVLLGWGADRWWHTGRVRLVWPTSASLPLSSMLGSLMLAIAAGLVAYGGLAGARTQLSIVNPTTVLATAADREALAWLDAHLPANAIVAVNGWNWLGGLWAGSDGGAWILPLTGRKTTLPPNDYAFGSRSYVSAIDDFNAQLAQAAGTSPTEVRALLRQAGVTHVYIGARGGPLKPEMFAGSPDYTLLYTNGAAWVFRVTGP